MRGKKQGSPPDPYKGLNNDFRGEVDSMKDEEINAKIKDVALADSALAEAKKSDEDLRRLREAVATANEPYKQGAKTNALKIRYMRDVLASRGRDVQTAGDFAKVDPEAE